MATQNRDNPRLGLMLIGLLALTLFILFARSLKPELVLFSSDGPLGLTSSTAVASPNTVFGAWVDVFWMGYNSGSAPPSLNFLTFFGLGPVMFAKMHAIVAMLFLGSCTYFFFAQLRFHPVVGGLAAIAAGLNSNYFSNACWGLPSRAFTLGFVFLALGWIATPAQRWSWVRTILAGFAVGMAVMEGADNGAIFSLYVAAFAATIWFSQTGSVGKNLGVGIVRLAIVVLCAGIIASQAIISLVGTQIKGVAGMQQDQETTEQRWDFATQWSLPKAEILRVIIPGMFGYRTDAEPPTPKGGEYWGAVGQTPGWDSHKQGTPRHSGSGEYAGVLVVLVALWALAQSFRGAGSTFTPMERKIIWFWGVAAFVSLLLAFGRHAPFYRLMYSLPYFSTIRNPIKFMHPFHLALLVMFGFGLQGMARLYLERALAPAQSFGARLKAWWAKAASAEKRWTMGCVTAVTLSFLGLLVYSSTKRSLQEYLVNHAFSAEEATAIASYSVREAGLFVLFLALAVALVVAVQAGVFAGRRAVWAGALMGLLLVVDLGRANRPWIKYFDYKERYATNALFDTLRDKPYQHRLTVALPGLQNLYRAEWLQHQFPYYNIQALDMPQEPRMPADKKAYVEAVSTNIARYWQLTSTRYLLGGSGQFVEQLNQQLDPEKRRFAMRMPFNVTASPSGKYPHVSADPRGPAALIEFTGALPRAKLYSRWQTPTNDQATLQQLVRPDFDPEQNVLVAESLPASPTGDGAASPGQVEITAYGPKAITLKAKATTPSVLLLNDKFDPEWKVWVDGKPDKMLRCNFIVRGVYLQPGEHTVEFKFQPSLRGLYVTLSAMALGVVLCGFLFVAGRRENTETRPKDSKAGRKE